jgi:DNA-binding Lrp family transcriptional regulator
MLDAIDRKIVAATQAGLPLVREPYRAVAEKLGLEQGEVIARLKRLLADEAVAEIGARIGALDEVTHCYERPRHLPLWPYNLFAMVHGHTREEVRGKVERIARLIGPAARAHDVLFSTRILKKTGLRIAA